MEAKMRVLPRYRKVIASGPAGSAVSARKCDRLTSLQGGDELTLHPPASIFATPLESDRKRLPLPKGSSYPPLRWKT